MNDRMLTQRVKSFWEAHPLCTDLISHPPGSEVFFEEYNRMRVAVIPYEIKKEI